MQDSLDDYIRIAKNSKQDEAKINKQQIVTSEKRKQCTERAMQIVEVAIEGQLRPEVFLKCLPYIDQSYYQDIVEERAISKLCGYPICGRKIPDMPKKQFHISTKQNKVYDITERKNFCSNFCYKAGLYIKKQVDTSPLWVRKIEDIPSFKLLPSSESGLLGEEINQGIIRPVVEPSFTSISAFTQVSLGAMVDQEFGGKREEVRKPSSAELKKNIKHKKTLATVLEDDPSTCSTSSVDGDEKKGKEKSPIENNKQKSRASSHNETENVELNKSDGKESSETALATSEVSVPLGYEDENMKLDRGNVASEHDALKINTIEEVKVTSETNIIKHKESKKRKSEKSTQNIEKHIRKCFKEWFSIETHIFIFGAEEVKTKLDDDKFNLLFDSMKLSEVQHTQQVKYIEICKRLDLKDLAEDKYDKSLLGRAGKRPLPDYEQLKEESKELDLKIKAFYGGVMFESDDLNFSTKKKEDRKQEDKGGNESEIGPPAVLPLVDSKSQTALRRKIFLTSANKTMQILLRKLRIPQLTIFPDLQSLVKTFELKADNIVFKPLEWNYICVALLKLLSLKDRHLQEALESDKGTVEYINLIISELPGRRSFLDFMLDLVKDSDMLIEKYLNGMSN